MANYAYDSTANFLSLGPPALFVYQKNNRAVKGGIRNSGAVTMTFH